VRACMHACMHACMQHLSASILLDSLPVWLSIHLQTCVCWQAVWPQQRSSRIMGRINAANARTNASTNARSSATNARTMATNASTNEIPVQPMQEPVQPIQYPPKEPVQPMQCNLSDEQWMAIGVGKAHGRKTTRLLNVWTSDCPKLPDAQATRQGHGTGT